MIAPRSKPLGGGQIDKSGKILTPEQVRERRKLAQALAAQASDTSPVGHWTAALNRALQGMTASYERVKADRDYEAGAAAARAKMEGRYSASPVATALAGGAGGGAAPTGNSFLDSLVKSESGGNWNALNSEGYGGRLQFGEARLADAARAGIIPAGMTGAEFSRLSPEQQMAVEQWHFADIDRQAAAMGLDKFIGQTVAGIPITQDAIRGMAHLGGIGGAAKFLQTGGAYNPSDSNGTSLADYAARHGGAPSVATGTTSNEIYSLMADPWVMDQYGSVLGSELAGVQQRENAIFNQQLAMQDPMYQLGLEQKRLELEAMKNPGKKPPIQVGDVLLDPDTLQPVYDGRLPATPEAPETQVFYDEATGQEYRAQWNPATMTWDRIGGVKAPKGPDTVVNNNMGGDKFAEEVGKGQAATFQEMSATGFTAQQTLGQLDRLEGLLAEGPSGASAALQSLLGSYGIDVGSAGTIQAAEALINAMIPSQRPAGSGPMSDKDIEMFKASLPRLINSPEGNALIIQTLRGIAQYDVQRAQIADRAMLPPDDPNHLTRAQAAEMLRGLQSPLAGFGSAASAFEAPSGAAGVVPDGIDPAEWEYLTPEEKALFQ